MWRIGPFMPTSARFFQLVEHAAERDVEVDCLGGSETLDDGSTSASGTEEVLDQRRSSATFRRRLGHLGMAF